MSLIPVAVQLLVGAVVTLLCVCVQTLANIALLYWVLRIFARVDRTFALVWRVSIVARLIFAFIAVHLAQVAIWALSYVLLGCFASVEEALYFSLASFSTSEYGATTLPHAWRLLGPLEGLGGIIAFGLSIAFIFTVLSRLHESRLKHAKKAQRGPASE